MAKKTVRDSHSGTKYSGVVRKGKMGLWSSQGKAKGKKKCPQSIHQRTEESYTTPTLNKTPKKQGNRWEVKEKEK